MTEQIKNVISIIENEKECVQSDCDRDCSRCELVKEEAEIVGAFDLSIRSLQAWDEVLNELEEKKDVYKLVSISNTAVGKAYTYDESTICMAIDIINQHLSEIEEGEEYEY